MPVPANNITYLASMCILCYVKMIQAYQLIYHLLCYYAYMLCENKASIPANTSFTMLAMWKWSKLFSELVVARKQGPAISYMLHTDVVVRICTAHTQAYNNGIPLAWTKCNLTLPHIIYSSTTRRRIVGRDSWLPADSHTTTASCDLQKMQQKGTWFESGHM